MSASTDCAIEHFCKKSVLTMIPLFVRRSEGSINLSIESRCFVPQNDRIFIKTLPSPMTLLHRKEKVQFVAHARDTTSIFFKNDHEISIDLRGSQSDSWNERRYIPITRECSDRIMISIGDICSSRNIRIVRSRELYVVWRF